MSRIKNKRELVLRAQGHARADHIEQGTYGNVRRNGDIKFRGCAIGCLATPHRKGAFRAFYDKVLARELNEVGVADEFRQVRDLKREFGICEPLARVAESAFEGQDTHGAAIEFIPRFAKALPEGVNITPRMVRAFLRRHLSEGDAEVTLGGWPEPDIAEPLIEWLESLQREAAGVS